VGLTVSKESTPAGQSARNTNFALLVGGQFV
jgi:hypothetical protein